MAWYKYDKCYQPEGQKATERVNQCSKVEWHKYTINDVKNKNQLNE